MLRWAQSPVASGPPKPPSHIVLIPEGSTFQQVAALLKNEQLIRSRSAFVLLGKTRDIDRKIRPGEYELDAGMSPQDILTKLLAGRVVLHPVTIPEGYSLTQIAEVLAAQQVTDTKEFTKLVRMHIGAHGDGGMPEGFLHDSHSDLVATIHANHLPGDAGGFRRRQQRSHRAKLLGLKNSL